ncbi:hypothetical protein [Liquorilactobacillus ghanensis]|uniref:hypothetical protein n=1 Tax=Liquorilactobacillus ghanensis TaxID=399370 RepID=UPI0039ED6C1F
MKKSIDAPLVPVAFIFFGLASLFSAVKTGKVTNFIVPVIFLSLAAIYLHTSLFGKYRIISSVVNELNIKSDAQVLDLGTGHGAFLVEIAKKDCSDQGKLLELIFGISKIKPIIHLKVLKKLLMSNI